MHLAGGAAQPPDGGNIDNGTAVLLYQIGNRRTAAVIDSIDIGSEHFPPVLRRNVCKQLDLRNAGIIDQNVQMPIFSYRKVDKGFCLIRLGNIRPKGARFVAAVPQFLTQVFRSLFPAAVAQHHIAALCRQTACRSSANPARRAGNNRNLAHDISLRCQLHSSAGAAPPPDPAGRVPACGGAARCARRAEPPYPCALQKFLLMIIANLPSAGKSP